MKKIAFFTLISFLTLLACGSGNKQDSLRKMEKQRNVLDEQIAYLKAGLAGAGSAAEAEERLTFVRTVLIMPSLFQHFTRVQGTVKSDNNILIPAQTSGVVKKILADEGDKVSKGQLLAELDSAIITSGISELETALSLATTIFERQERLWNKQIGSEIEYLTAKNNRESLEKKLKTSQEQLRLTKITSPIDGRVDNILIKEGEMAVAGRGAIRIVQLSKLKIVAALAENYISRVKKNHIVKVKVPFLGVEFEHAINAVSQVIDPNNRTFQIEIKVPRNLSSLKPNLLAVVTINDYSNSEALTVPHNVIQETETEKFLFVAEQQEGRWIANKRTVITGSDYNNQVEIIDGLSQGEQVVILGFQNLTDGQPIAFENEK